MTRCKQQRQPPKLLNNFGHTQIWPSDHDIRAISGQWLDIAGYQDSRHGSWLDNCEFGHNKTKKARIMPNCSAHCHSPFSLTAVAMNNHYTHRWTSSWLDAVWRTVVPCYTRRWKIKSHSITEVFLCTICTTLCSISLQRRKKTCSLFRVIHYKNYTNWSNTQTMVFHPALWLKWSH